MTIEFGTEILKSLPFFAGLSEEECRMLEGKYHISAYPKGALIYKYEDPPGAFYCVLSGRIAAYLKDEHGRNRFIDYLHRGQYFGIISLLTGEPHSVTAEAFNDSRLVIINREDFEALLEKIPRMGLELSRTLSRRLRSRDSVRKEVFETEIIAVMGLSPASGKTFYTANLAFSLRRETGKNILVVELRHKNKLHSMPAIFGFGGGYSELDLSEYRQSHGSDAARVIMKGREGLDFLCLNYSGTGGESAATVVDILSSLFCRYHYIILDLPLFNDRFVSGLLRQAQILHLVSGPSYAELRRTESFSTGLERDKSFSRENIKVIVNDYGYTRLRPEERSGVLGRDVFATLPGIRPPAEGLETEKNPATEYSRAVRRIARQSGGCTTGLALGVGFAYGLCHLGVLKVLEEERIPIDVISGSSMGGLIASLWVTGKSSEEILAIAGEFKDYTCAWKLIDLTFPLTGFIKGNKLYRFLKRHLGNKTFKDVKLPLKIVASDIRRKEARVLDSGSLVDAIMTSCSMPGIFRPFMSRGDILLDGGIAHPLPVEVLVQSGARRIIAVNVTPSRDTLSRGLERAQEKIAGAQLKRSALARFVSNRLSLNILDLIFSSVEYMQSELARKESALADVVINPDTSGLFWLDLHRAAEFSQRGERETRRHLQQIRDLAGN
ncbi:MAG: patatin-like phospholipase family protein [Candidatus Omnitrophota bacterium]